MHKQTHAQTHAHAQTNTHLQAPHCLQEEDLDSALKRAMLSPLEDVQMNTRLTNDHIVSLRRLDGLVHQGKDIYEEVKSVSGKMMNGKFRLITCFSGLIWCIYLSVHLGWFIFPMCVCIIMCVWAALCEFPASMLSQPGIAACKLVSKLDV